MGGWWKGWKRIVGNISGEGMIQRLEKGRICCNLGRRTKWENKWGKMSETRIEIALLIKRTAAGRRRVMNGSSKIFPYLIFVIIITSVGPRYDQKVKIINGNNNPITIIIHIRYKCKPSVELPQV